MTKNRTYRFLFWFLFLVSILATIWWSLYIPYRPQHLYRVMPVHASLVSAHYDVASRWNDILANPVTRSLLASMGCDLHDLEKTSRDKTFRTWLKKLASDDVVVAHLPTMGTAHAEAWVFASWLGGKSQRLRWTLAFASLPGLKKTVQSHGRVVWELETDLFKTGEKLTLSLVEGMLIGCISKGEGMPLLLDAFDGRYPSLKIRKELLLSGATDQCRDRGWFKVRAMPKQKIYTSTRLRYELNAITSNSLGGKIQLPWAMPVTSNINEPLPKMISFAEDQALASFYINSALVTMMQQNSSNAWSDIARVLVPQNESKSLFVALLGDEFSGRFKGFKLPSVFVGVPLEKEANDFDVLLDDLNARYRWGLVTQPVSVGSNVAYAIESTAENFYAETALEEQLAYAITDRWVLFSSNLAGLTNLMVASEIHTNHRTGTDPDLTAMSGAIDLQRGGKALRLAITAYGLKLAMENPLDSQPMRQKMNEAKAWIDALAPLGTLNVELNSTDKGSEIIFHTKGISQ